MITDLIGCQFEARHSTIAPGCVWLDLFVDGHNDSHCLSREAAETLGRQLIEAANTAPLRSITPGPIE